MTAFGYGGLPPWLLVAFGIIAVAYLGYQIALVVRRRNRTRDEPPSE